MAFTFDFFSDAGLTAVIVGPIPVSQKDDGSSAPFQQQYWLGSIEAGKKVQALSNAGIGQITVTITDTTPGLGHLPSEIQLALTQGGLAAATPGAALDIGLTATSAAPLTFWAQVVDATGVVSSVTELGVTSNILIETVL